MSIQFINKGGEDINNYFDVQLNSGTSTRPGVLEIIKTIPNKVKAKGTSLNFAFCNCTNLITIPLIDTKDVTSMTSMFSNCNSLEEIPLLDTSNVTNMNSMFRDCYNLVTIPLLNTSKVTNMTYMFGQCSKLSNESLNNILAMCTNATLITNVNFKKLSILGISSSQATTCQGLSNYADFIAAGWTA